MEGKSGAASPFAGRDPHVRVRAMVDRHGATLQRIARHFSLTAEDAQDAYQRALEIYFRRLDSLDPRTEAAWLKVVVRNEALAVRRSRAEAFATDDVDLDSRPPSDERALEDRVAGAERVARSAEALRHLKRDEARALVLKAEGLSYDEIGERYGWTYTKVNRSITEGRRRFMQVFRRIESGEECERFYPVLAELARGAASGDAVLELRPHLRHCAACRAEIRRLHVAGGSGLAVFVPLQAVVDRLKGDLYGLFGRLSAAEPLTAQVAGAGRGAGTAALVALCLGGAGAGGYCLATGSLLGAPALVRHDGNPDKLRPAQRNAVRAVRARVATTTTARPPSPTFSRTSLPTPTPTPKRTRTRSSEFAFEGSPPGSTPSPAKPKALAATTARAGSPQATPTRAARRDSDGEFGFEQ